jgi:hypothetical protein
MHKQTRYLLTVIFGNLLLCYLFAYLRHQLYGSDIETYLSIFLLAVVIIILPAFLLGLIAWSIYKRLQPNIALYFVMFNLIGFLFLGFLNLNQAYKTWHYNKYQANIDYNESLSKQGGYLDTCMTLVQHDISRKAVSLNDFRILSFSYELALSTVPRDTTNKYYSFEVFYSLIKNNETTVRAASYLINFNKKIIRIYDIDTKNEKAKRQMESLRKNFKNLKGVLEKASDSSGEFDELKEKLKVLE